MNSTAAGLAGTTERAIEELILDVKQDILVRAPIDVTFEALLEQMGAAFTTPDETPMPMKIEARPGGRWYRDLGGEDGHFWGHVQAIKRPTLLEITGPMFMSYPVASNIQYRLSEVDGGTLISLHHSAFGLIQSNHREGVGKGWSHIGESVRKRAEAGAAGKKAAR
jgi:uncharacterized protein YndB with AHSA1/START domain